jgi:hypothetical protein
VFVLVSYKGYPFSVESKWEWKTLFGWIDVALFGVDLLSRSLVLRGRKQRLDPASRTPYEHTVGTRTRERRLGRAWNICIVGFSYCQAS